MTGAPQTTRKDLLSELVTGDAQTTTDELLKIFDDDQVESDDDN